MSNLKPMGTLKIVNVEQARADALLLEAELKKMPQVDVPLYHHFSKDVYAREVHLAAGCFFMGKIHKERNLNILAAGEVSVLDVGTGKAERFRSPHVFVAEPGAKRLVYVHRNASWIVVHGTAETDLEKIESQFIAKTFDEIQILPEHVKALQEAQCPG
jgi:hypothetical protein